MRDCRRWASCPCVCDDSMYVRTYYRFVCNVPFGGQIVRLPCLPTGYASPTSTETAATPQRGGRQPEDVQKHRGRGESPTRRDICNFISWMHLVSVLFPLMRSIPFETTSWRSFLGEYRVCPYSNLVKAQRSGYPTLTATSPQQRVCTDITNLSLYYG